MFEIFPPFTQLREASPKFINFRKKAHLTWHPQPCPNSSNAHNVLNEISQQKSPRRGCINCRAATAKTVACFWDALWRSRVKTFRQPLLAPPLLTSPAYWIPGKSFGRECAVSDVYQYLSGPWRDFAFLWPTSTVQNRTHWENKLFVTI